MAILIMLFVSKPAKTFFSFDQWPQLYPVPPLLRRTLHWIEYLYSKQSHHFDCINFTHIQRSLIFQKNKCYFPSIYSCCISSLKSFFRVVGTSSHTIKAVLKTKYFSFFWNHWNGNCYQNIWLSIPSEWIGSLNPMDSTVRSIGQEEKDTTTIIDVYAYLMAIHNLLPLCTWATSKEK